MPDIRNIDLTQAIQEEESKLLAALFNQYPDIPRFKKNETYTINYPDATTQVEIKLSNSVLKRQRVNKKGEEGFRYEIQSEVKKYGPHGNRKTVGEGAFGRVYISLGALKVEGDRAVMTTFRPRVMKKQLLEPTGADVGLFKPSKPREGGLAAVHAISTQAAKDEYSLMADAPHLKAKPLVFVTKGGKEVTYSVMKQLPGSELFDQLENDSKYNPRLSADERFRMSIRLIETFQEQVYERNIVHRDLKPQNVYYDNKTDEVNYFDFGLSKKANVIDNGQLLGSPLYMPPEMFLGQGTTYKSDVFALGKILIQVWRGDIGEVDGTTPETLINSAYANSIKVPIKPIFGGVWEIDPVLQNSLVNFFKKMTFVDPTQRPTLDEALTALKRIQAKFDRDKMTAPYMLNEIDRALYDYEQIASSDSLQANMLRAIKDYINATHTPKNIAAKDYAASPRRQRDMRDLLNIIFEIADPPSANALEAKVVARLAKIETGTFGTAWLGRSELRKKINNSIADYKQEQVRKSLGH